VRWYVIVGTKRIFLETIDLDGRLVKDGVRKSLKDRQNALTELVHVIQNFRKLAEKQPLTLQGSEYAHAVQELNKAIDRAEGCCNDCPFADDTDGRLQKKSLLAGIIYRYHHTLDARSGPRALQSDSFCG
jgi:hypothetical protein